MILKYFKSSLRRKLVLTTVVIQAVMLTALVWNSVRIAENHLIQQTENRINEILPLLNASINAPFLEYDIAVLDELLTQVVRQKGIRYIQLSMSDDREVIAAGEALKVDMQIESQEHRVALKREYLGAVFEVVSPITVSSRPLGTMRVQFNVSYIVQALQALRSQGALIAAIEIILSIVLLTLIGLALTRHLMDLTKAARKMSEGDLSVRVSETSMDEIGQTAHAFNEMAANRMHVESALRTLACAGTESGDSFFEEVVKMLNATFGSQYAFIGLLNQTTHDSVRTEYVAVNDEIVPNFEYRLEQSPCENVLDHNMQLISADVASLYPDDNLLQQMKLQSYLGAPLIDSNGITFGLLVVTHTAPIVIEPWMSLMLEVFANRIVVEMERTEATRTMRESESKLQAVIDNAPALISIKDMDGRINMVNRRFDLLAGPLTDEYIGKTLAELYPQDIAQQQWEHELDEMKRQGSVEIEEVIEHKNGKMHTYHTVKFPLLDSNTQMPFAICSIATDISERIEAEETIRFMAYRDALTGLHNRNEFEARVENALKSTHEYQHEHALLYLDLDQFKVINDTSGHSAGDEMLRQLSTILLKNVRERDTMARLGGDEFGLLMENCPLQRAEEIADKLIEIISEFRFVWEGRTFAVGVSIGISRISSDSVAVADVLKSADVACYAAKDAGRNRYHIYSEDDDELVERQKEMNWVSVIREALDHEDFVLFQQPIISLDAEQPSETMYEHLVRMRSKDGKVIMPGSFLSSAERYNLMQAVDRYVIREVISFAYSGRDSRPQNSRLFINLSGTSLNDEGLVDYINQQFLAFNIDPSRICFEITETAAIANLNRASQFITEIKRLGCLIALDDFGSGLSSFSYLKALPVDYIKIDGSFVRDIMDDPMDTAIVEAIHQLGQAAGIQTIAEFVENIQIMEKLRTIGINYAQGYGIARPSMLDAVDDQDVVEKTSKG